MLFLALYGTCKYRFSFKMLWKKANMCKPYSIFDIICWGNESSFNESEFVAKFENILDLLFAGSGVSVRGVEGTSDSTKSMVILNDYDSTFGR